MHMFLEMLGHNNTKIYNAVCLQELASPPFQLKAVNIRYSIARSRTISNYKKILYLAFSSACVPLLKTFRDNDVKIYKVFFSQKLCVLFAAIPINVL